MPFSSEAVANEFLRLAKSRGETLTPMKLQKLAYMSHGWALGLLGKPLVNEQVEAWKYGPVIPSLYHEFKHFGRGQIDELATTWDLHPNGKIVSHNPQLPEEDPDFAPTAAELIEAVYDRYAKYSAIQLSNATHKEGSPWYTVYVEKWNHNPPQGTDIPTELIEKHYKKLWSDAQHTKSI